MFVRSTSYLRLFCLLRTTAICRRPRHKFYVRVTNFIFIKLRHSHKKVSCFLMKLQDIFSFPNSVSFYLLFFFFSLFYLHSYVSSCIILSPTPPSSFSLSPCHSLFISLLIYSILYLVLHISVSLCSCHLSSCFLVTHSLSLYLYFHASLSFIFHVK